MTRTLVGLGVAIGAVGAAVGIHALAPVIPMLTACVVLGALFGNLAPTRARELAAPGLSLAARRLLRIGVVLLGLKLSLFDIAELGWLALLLIVAVVLVTFALTIVIARAAGLPGHQPLLIAAGFSICGASAIGAMSAVTGAKDEESATPIALVTLCGTLAIGLLPFLAVPLGLAGNDFGIWVGGSVHDVGQVVATAQVAGVAALAAAVLVKLTRVLMLAPLVAITSLVITNRVVRNGDTDEHGKRPPLVPLFVLGFLAAMLVRTFIPLPDAVLITADVIQTALLGLALVGLGSAIRVSKLVRTGGRAALVGLASWAIISALAFGVVLATGAA